MDEKITIIEGPPPIFEHVNDGWAIGLNESPHVLVPALTRLRTFNGNALVERCHRAWNKGNIHLQYRNDMGWSRLRRSWRPATWKHLTGMYCSYGCIWIRSMSNTSSTMAMKTAPMTIWNP